MQLVLKQVIPNAKEETDGVILIFSLIIDLVARNKKSINNSNVIALIPKDWDLQLNEKCKPCSFREVELAMVNDDGNWEGRGAGEVERPLLLKM